MDDPSTTAVRWDILSGCGHGFEFVFASLYSIASRTTTLVCTVWVERNTNCWHENMMGSLLLLRIAKLLLQHAFTRWNCRVPAMAMDVHICKSLYYCIIASRDDTWASQAGTNFLQPRDIMGKHLEKRIEKENGKDCARMTKQRQLPSRYTDVHSKEVHFNLMIQGIYGSW